MFCVLWQHAGVSMSFHVPEKLRVTKGEMASSKEYGNNGAFDLGNLFVVASDGMGWEHVSISPKEDRDPTWAEMCRVKDMFWGEEDCVIQYHPPKSKYVDVHSHCLHLWRPISKELPVPPTTLV